MSEIKSEIIKMCDFCQKTKTDKVCYFCGKDICYMCAILTNFDCNLLYKDNYFYHDAISYICESCWEKGDKIRHKIMELRTITDKQEEELINQWKNMIK